MPPFTIHIHTRTRTHTHTGSILAVPFIPSRTILSFHTIFTIFTIFTIHTTQQTLNTVQANDKMAFPDGVWPAGTIVTHEMIRWFSDSMARANVCKFGPACTAVCRATGHTCARLQSLIQHANRCTLKAKCKSCKDMWKTLMLHARLCTTGKGCTIPCCSHFKHSKKAADKKRERQRIIDAAFGLLTFSTREVRSLRSLRSRDALCQHPTKFKAGRVRFVRARRHS